MPMPLIVLLSKDFKVYRTGSSALILAEPIDPSTHWLDPRAEKRSESRTAPTEAEQV
jgi:hypothetical protein